jgi:hypothetical protein
VQMSRLLGLSCRSLESRSARLETCRRPVLDTGLGFFLTSGVEGKPKPGSGPVRRRSGSAVANLLAVLWSKDICRKRASTVSSKGLLRISIFAIKGNKTNIFQRLQLQKGHVQ